MNMSKLICGSTLIAMAYLYSTTGTACIGSTHTVTNYTNKLVKVDARYAACSNEAFYLNPGQSWRKCKGLCNLTSMHAKVFDNDGPNAREDIPYDRAEADKLFEAGEFEKWANMRQSKSVNAGSYDPPAGFTGSSSFSINAGAAPLQYSVCRSCPAALGHPNSLQ